jgi:hypothetical protein
MDTRSCSRTDRSDDTLGEPPQDQHGRVVDVAASIVAEARRCGSDNHHWQAEAIREPAGDAASATAMVGAVTVRLTAKLLA